MRKVKRKLFGALGVALVGAILIIAFANTNNSNSITLKPKSTSFPPNLPPVPKNPPSHPPTDTIQHTVLKGKIIRINTTWDYHVYENGKQVIDPFASLDRWTLSSFTIYPIPVTKNYGVGCGQIHYTSMGFSIVALNADYTIIDKGDLVDASGRQYQTIYTYNSNGSALKKVTTLVRFIAPVSGGYLLPVVRESTGAWYGYSQGHRWNCRTNYGEGSIVIPGNFMNGTPYTVELVDEGIHNFTAASVSIAQGSYLFLLRGFFKDSTDPSVILVDANGTTHHPEVDWHQSRLSSSLANIKIDIANNATVTWTISKIEIMFDKVQYGMIQFTTPITMYPSDYILFNINVKA